MLDFANSYEISPVQKISELVNHLMCSCWSKKPRSDVFRITSISGSDPELTLTEQTALCLAPLYSFISFNMPPTAPASQPMNVKLLLIGNSSVGKSSLLLRFSDEQWLPEDESSATIGVDFRVRYTSNLSEDKLFITLTSTRFIKWR